MSADHPLLERLLQDPTRPLSAEDASFLLSLEGRGLLADKVLAVHFFKAGDMDRALELGRAVLAREPSSENVKNVLHVLTKSGRFEEAVEFSELHGALIDPILRQDMMCMLFNAMGDVQRAVACGTEALRLKDEASRDAPATDVFVKPFDPEARERNVIAFSLFGEDPRYLLGARNNAIVARYIYQGWTARFYVDDSVPRSIQNGLVAEGAQVLKVGNWPSKTHGLFWRFLVEDDPDVDVYLVRDADSVLNVRERLAVEQWLRSKRAFHIMRDDPQHSELILAGMWGARRGNIGYVRERIDTYLAAAPVAINDAAIDQRFLREEIWPIAKHSLLCHDAHLRFGDTAPWPDVVTLPKAFNVGQNDWVNYSPTNPPAQGRGSGGTPR